MRSKAPLAVGQGCKLERVPVTLFKTRPGKRCACHPDQYLLVCRACGEYFHSTAPQTKTCSDKCRKRLSRSRNDKLFQAVLSYASGQ